MATHVGVVDTVTGRMFNGANGNNIERPSGGTVTWNVFAGHTLVLDFPINTVSGVGGTSVGSNLIRYTLPSEASSPLSLQAICAQFYYRVTAIPDDGSQDARNIADGAGFRRPRIIVNGLCNDLLREGLANLQEEFDDSHCVEIADQMLNLMLRGASFKEDRYNEEQIERCLEKLLDASNASPEEKEGCRKFLMSLLNQP